MQIHQSKIKYDRKDLKNLQEEKYKNYKMEFNRLTKEKKTALETELNKSHSMISNYFSDCLEDNSGEEPHVRWQLDIMGSPTLPYAAAIADLLFAIAAAVSPALLPPARKTPTSRSADHSGGANGPNPSCSKTRWRTLLSHDEKVIFFW